MRQSDSVERSRPAKRGFPHPVAPKPKQVGIAFGVVAALLCVLVVAISAGVVIRWRNSHAAPAPTTQLPPVAGPAARQEPSATAIPPAAAYVKTPWGTRCQVGRNEIICDTCEPGLLLDTPAGADCPGPSLNELIVHASGASLIPAAGAILPASPDIQQLSEGQTYRVNGWTIAVSGWVRFTNDATGHGMAVAAQNRDYF